METNNVHILFIDDRPDVIEEAREWLLEDFSYQNLETATSAQEAKEKLQQQSFDVIVADMRMERDDSGFEILDWVRDHNLSAVVEGKDVCGVYVRKSEIPAFFIKVEQKENTVFEFYRRFGNSSKQLKIPEIYNFFLLGSDSAQARRR